MEDPTPTVLCWLPLYTPYIFFLYSTISLAHLEYNKWWTFIFWTSWHPNLMLVLTVFNTLYSFHLHITITSFLFTNRIKDTLSTLLSILITSLSNKIYFLCVYQHILCSTQKSWLLTVVAMHIYFKGTCICIHFDHLQF